jgi:putative transposase
MARFARVVVPGCPHHLIQRGNRRQRVFFSDEDKGFYLNLLGRQAERCGLSIWAFCLMENHVHIIAVPEAKDSFARGFGEVQRRYTLVINTRQNWKGFLWQGRFISYPLDEGHSYAAVRYVERNPVRAGVVKRAELYEWSSARAHVRREVHPLLSAFPMEAAIPNWSAYLGQSDSPEDIDELLRHERTGRPLGSEDFVKRLEGLTGRVLALKKKGRKKEMGNRYCVPHFNGCSPSAKAGR